MFLPRISDKYPKIAPYGGYTLRSEIEAPLRSITREVLPETYFLLVIMLMAADAQARPFLQFQASC